MGLFHDPLAFDTQGPGPSSSTSALARAYAKADWCLGQLGQRAGRTGDWEIMDIGDFR